MATALVQHEALWVAAWASDSEGSLHCLAVPLIVRPPDGPALAVGLDERALAAVAGARWMVRLGVSVPPAAAAASLQEQRVRVLHASLMRTLDERAGVLARAPPRVASLVARRLYALDADLARRGGELTWTSAGAQAFVDAARDALRELGAVVDALALALDRGVDCPSAAAAGVALLPPPPGTPQSAADFAASVAAHVQKAGEELRSLSEAAARGAAEVARAAAEPPLAALGRRGAAPDDGLLLMFRGHCESLFKKAGWVLGEGLVCVVVWGGAGAPVAARAQTLRLLSHYPGPTLHEDICQTLLTPGPDDLRRSRLGRPAGPPGVGCATGVRGDARGRCARPGAGAQRGRRAGRRRLGNRCGE